MTRKRKKKRSLIAVLFGSLLCAVDWLCESIAGACVALLKGITSLIAWLILGMFRLLGLLGKVILAVPAWLLRKIAAPKNTAARCLKLDGPEFEAYVALVLQDNGFKHVALTKGSGDQGVDILAERNGKTYAVQCKNYEGAVGNFAVQEAYTGAQFYGCDAAAVICPGEFTRGAKELAQHTGVLLWDGKKLSRMMRISGRRPRHRS